VSRKRLQIGVSSLEETLARASHLWKRAARGDAVKVEERLSFESLPLMLRTLTPARWDLLAALRQAGKMSIKELATTLERDYKNVHTDVAKLIELGLIERTADGKIGVPWDVISAELRLAA
jgi:predicted transcriptional regulator